MSKTQPFEEFDKLEEMVSDIIIEDLNKSVVAQLKKLRTAIQEIKASKIQELEMAKKKTLENRQKRLKEVWSNFIEWADREEDLDEIEDRLNEWLDEIHGEDGFGTEGQNDPRGDSRDLDTRPRI